jgi:excisionase family DNA binding protein
MSGATPVNDHGIAYSVPDAARAIGVSPRTIYNLGERGELQLIKLGGRTLVRRSDLEALIERAAMNGHL